MVYDDEKIANDNQTERMNMSYNVMKGIDTLSSNNKNVEKCRIDFLESCLTVDGIISVLQGKVGKNSAKKLQEFSNTFKNFKKHFNVDTQILGKKIPEKNNYCGYVNEIYKQIEKFLEQIDTIICENGASDYKKDIEQIINLLRSANNMYVECKYKI